MAPNNSLLSLENVSFEYQFKGSSFLALNDVSLTIKKGEFVAIIGASGSGKSTLMNLVGLMAHPTLGNIRIDGNPVGHLSDDELAQLRNEKIGFVFQQFHLLPRLDVLDNVLLPTEYVENSKHTREYYRSQAVDLLSRFGLSDQLEKRPASLSGGQKQRVAICRALVCNPDLILADEPTGALDSKNSKLVLDILQELNNQGKTVVLITHDPAVAARASRVLKIHDGKITADEKNPKTNRSHEKLSSDDELFQNLAKSQEQSSEIKKCGRGLQGLGSIQKTVQLALQSVAANKVRSALTIFGLMIGVSSIIIMLTLTAEARSAFKRFFDTKGGNQGTITFDGRTAERSGSPRWRGWHVQHDFAKLNQAFSKYGRIDPVVDDSGCNVKSNTRTFALDLVGMSSLEEAGEQELKLQKGRFFRPEEMRSATEGKVTLLGSEAAENLFPPTDPGYSNSSSYPLGETLFVRGCRFESAVKIVGILEPRDTLFDTSINSSLTLPTRAMLGNGLSPYRTRMVSVPHEGISPTWFTESVKNYIALQTQNKFPFRIFVPEQQIQKINLMLNVLGGLTVVVGGLCTLIGGIGVMNIMLVNIAERIKEIGIRKALGARAFRIRNQFLLETVGLCFISGVLGVVAGLLVCNGAMLLAAHFMPRYLEPQIAWNTGAVVLALTSSLFAGVTFGLLPAKRAAAMDIIDALRQE